MKINKYIGWAVCSLWMAACQNNDMDIVQPQDSEKYTLVGQIGGGGQDSRAQIVFGSQDTWTEYFFWNEGDCFTLYQQVNNGQVETPFTINENYTEAGGGEQFAEFTSTKALTPSASYLAMYPSPTTVTDNKVTLEVQRSLDFSSASTQAQRDAVWKNYFKNNMFMVAKGELSQSGRNYVNFDHLCSLARITYVNKTGSEQRINGVRLEGQNLGFKMDYNLASGQEVGSASFTNFRFTTTGLTVANNENVDLYIFFFPKAIEDTDLKIVIQQPAGEKYLTLPVMDLLMANNYYESFRAGCRYWFDLTDTENGLDWTKNTLETGLITFDNLELSQALHEVLGDYRVKLKSDGRAVMTKQHAEAVTELNFSSYNGTISSLAGIEAFKYLQRLDCYSKGLTTCNLSGNTELTHVHLYNNQLTALDLSANTKLVDLNCAQNFNLASLNIDNCTKLNYLIIDDNKLTSIQVPNPSEIFQLCYSRTQLTLDLSQFTGVLHLSVCGNGLSSLNLTSETKRNLVSLFCEINNLKSLNLSEYPNLTTLRCYGNRLSILDVTPASKMKDLVCGIQQNNVVLNLILSDLQKSMWNEYWVNDKNNGNIALRNGNTNGNDFPVGGIY